MVLNMSQFSFVAVVGWAETFTGSAGGVNDYRLGLDLSTHFDFISPPGKALNELWN
jgi:hypothetical protein